MPGKGANWLGGRTGQMPTRPLAFGHLQIRSTAVSQDKLESIASFCKKIKNMILGRMQL